VPRKFVRISLLVLLIGLSSWWRSVKRKFLEISHLFDFVVFYCLSLSLLLCCAVILLSVVVVCLL